MTYASDLLATNPVSYWRLGEASGTTAQDEKGVHPATVPAAVLKGEPGGITGDSNTCYYYDGATDIVPSTGWTLSSAAYTVMALVKMSTAVPTTYHCTIMGLVKDADTTQRASFVARRNATGNYMAYWDNTNTWKESSVSLALNTWVHVALVVNGTNAKIYHNGTQVLNATITAPADTYGTLYLGCATAAGWDNQKGWLDEIAVWSSALSATTVGDLHTSWTTNGTPGGGNPPVASAGADQASIEPYSIVHLSGSGSASGGKTITGYAWEQTAGSPTATLTDANTQTASYMAPGTLAGTTQTFQLTVTDSADMTDTDDMVVSTMTATERVVTGQAEVAVGLFGAVSDATMSSGAATGGISLAGSVTGKRSPLGAASGTMGWAGSSTGQHPSLAPNSGAATGAIGLAGSATSKRYPKGAATGAIGLAGSVTGEMPAAARSYVGQVANGANSATCNLAWSTVGTVQSGDVAVLVWNMSTSVSPTGNPSGFSPCGATAMPTEDGTLRSYVYTKVLTGSESGNLSLVLDNLTRQTACLVVYRGYTGVTANVVAKTEASGTPGVTHSSNAVTFSGTATILSACCERGSPPSVSSTAPTGYTTRSEANPGGTGGTYTVVAEKNGSVTTPVSSPQTPGAWTTELGTVNALTWSIAINV